MRTKACKSATILAAAAYMLIQPALAGVRPIKNFRDQVQADWLIQDKLAKKDRKDAAIDFKKRWEQRKKRLSDPLLDFDAILFTKRVPGSYTHMSDQYLGWWSRPGGGIYILRGFKTDNPTTQCITTAFKAPGSFLRPMLSYDAKKVLFAWCRFYPKLRGEPNKLSKATAPEDSFYHLYEMNVDGTGVRQLTHGKYNDFDARYLPNGRIVFLSTRRGHAIQVGRESAAKTMRNKALPECYVRCGGGPERPCAVYTLHTMNPDGKDMIAISPFAMFEWTPSVAADGTIIYSRWDYVDRNNHPFMSMWAINPDGTNARLVYGNYTWNPSCTFEPRSIPNSNKIIFTAAAHHIQTMGSLVLLDPTAGQEGLKPLKRLTPEVIFPESEGWPTSYYANPWPLSEQLYLVTWGQEPGNKRMWNHTRIPNGMGMYLFNADGTRELLHRDPKTTSSWPIPLKARTKPITQPDTVNWDGPKEGKFLLADVYNGLEQTKRGAVKSLRIIAIPPKTDPRMNYPNLGITREEPGKCVLGTVPVEKDGSAYFRTPAGVPVFFQALDNSGMAIQTMRSATHVQPGTTLSCNGCHEPRNKTPLKKGISMAAKRAPSKLTPGPEGTWPLRYDVLVKPVLDRNCIKCHNPKGKKPKPAKFNLAQPARKTYSMLIRWGKPNLSDHVMSRHRKGASIEGKCAASQSPLLKKIKSHKDLKISQEDMNRLVVWMDVYAQFQGSFSVEQEKELLDLRKQWASMLKLSGKTGARK
jgi:hypothetical protein